MHDRILNFLKSRLLDPRSPATTSMTLRPKLQTLADSLLQMLTDTCQRPGDNHSFLLIGSRGVGKTLVSLLGHDTLSACSARTQEPSSRPP